MGRLSNMEEQEKLMIKCKVCGRVFSPNIEAHYKARDLEVTGISTIARKEEVKYYDAFDCPCCGCQVIAQERKHSIKTT